MKFRWPWDNREFEDAVLGSLARIELALKKSAAEEKRKMDEIIQTLEEQDTVIDSIVTLVTELKAHQDDPEKLAEIVGKLDANTVKLAALKNTPDA